LEPTEPSKEFLKEVRESLLNIHAISFLAGQYFVRLKTEIDQTTAKKIKKSKKFNEPIFDLKIEDIAAYNVFLMQFAKIPDKNSFMKIKPITAIKWLSSKLMKKTFEYLKKIEDAVGDKIDISAKLAFYDNAKHLTEFITNSLDKGESLKKTIKKLGKQELLDKIGITDNNKYYLETVVRTNQVTAMSAGERVESLASPYVDFYEYNAIIDPRTTDICSSLNGIVMKKDDSFWDTHLPPNHFNCRSRVLTLSKDLADLLKIKETGTEGAKMPAESFAVDPSKTWSLPTKDMRQRLADHLDVPYKEIPKGAKFKE